VVVQPFPDPTGGRWPISTEGGLNPRWRGDGRELYYRDPSGRIVAVTFTPGAPPAIGKPTALFPLTFPVGTAPGGSLFPYDVHPSGERFLVAVPDDAEGRTTQPLTVTLNAPGLR
jgi:hypothetical protein